MKRAVVVAEMQYFLCGKELWEENKMIMTRMDLCVFVVCVCTFKVWLWKDIYRVNDDYD